MLCCYLSIHKHFCHTTIQEYFDCYIFKHIYLSTPIFNHISFNILNILLIVLWLTSFFAMLLGISICVLLCYTFLYGACHHSSVLPQFFLFCFTFWIYNLSFFLFQYFFSYCISSSILYTLHPCYLFLFYFFFFSILPSRSHTACFLHVFWEEILAFSFCRFGLFCFYIFHNPYTLLLSFLSIILSQAKVYLLEVCSTPYNIPVLFSI